MIEPTTFELILVLKSFTFEWKGYPQKSSLPWYSWNIVESSVKLKNSEELSFAVFYLYFFHRFLPVYHMYGTYIRSYINKCPLNELISNHCRSICTKVKIGAELVTRQIYTYKKVSLKPMCNVWATVDQGGIVDSWRVRFKVRINVHY